MSKPLLLGIVLLALAAPDLAAAASSMQRYDTPGTWPLGVSCAGCVGLNVGGVAFLPGRARPIEVRVDDDRAGEVAFTACQDFDRDNNCGETFEPIVKACGGAAALSASPVLFRPDFVTTVFLAAADGSGCGIGTRGWVTLTTG